MSYSGEWAMGKRHGKVCNLDLSARNQTSYMYLAKLFLEQGLIETSLKWCQTVEA